MSFLPLAIEEYAKNHSQSEPFLLQELARRTHLQVLNPRMLSGHLQGRFLSLISKLIRPKSILEIGTFTGYSTLCLLEGLDENGIIHTIDVNEELQDIQNEFFQRSGRSQSIKQYLGNAVEIIPQLNTCFDLVFIDADKKNYSVYFQLVIEKMNRGGVILSDNVLWNGKVIDAIKHNDKQTQSLLSFNKLMNEDGRVETILLPIRDGLTISRVL